MKAKSTPLTFKSFIIEKSVFELIEPNNIKSANTIDFPKYPIDINFDHYLNENLIKVEMNIAVNAKRKYHGIKIVVNAFGIFILNSQDLDQRQIFNLQVISTTSIMINSIRNFISQLTSFTPMGIYILPTIDVNHLLLTKYKELNKNIEHQK